MMDTERMMIKGILDGRIEWSWAVNMNEAREGPNPMLARMGDLNVASFTSPMIIAI